jgi:hypothetical protein
MNDCSLGDFIFDKTSPRAIELALPPNLLEAGCKLEFGIEEPERPSDTIGTKDERRLGFFFRQIRIAGQTLESR